MTFLFNDRVLRVTREDVLVYPAVRPGSLKCRQNGGRLWSAKQRLCALQTKDAKMRCCGDWREPSMWRTQSLQPVPVAVAPALWSLPPTVSRETPHCWQLLRHLPLLLLLKQLQCLASLWCGCTTGKVSVRRDKQAHRAMNFVEIRPRNPKGFEYSHSEKVQICWVKYTIC